MVIKYLLFIRWMGRYLYSWVEVAELTSLVGFSCEAAKRDAISLVVGPRLFLSSETSLINLDFFPVCS